MILNDFKEKVFNLVGDEYTVLSNEWKGNKEKYLFRHNKCGNEYKVRAVNFTSLDRRCPFCSNKRPKLTNEDFIERFKSLVGNEYDLLSKYKNNKTKIKVRHNKCGNEYEVRPDNFTDNNQRCPNCKGGVNITHDEFIKNTFNKCKNHEEYKVLTKYKNTKTKIEFLHLNCNNKFEMRPNDFQQGQRCPYCNVIISKGENKIIDYLENKKYKYIKEKRFENCKYKRTLPFDFQIFINDEKFILLEYDGKQHFQESFYGENLEEQKIRDSIKDQYCKDNNIKLYRIKYTDYDNINTILDNILKEHCPV